MLVRRRPCKHLVVLDFQDKFVKLKDNFYFSMIVLKCLNLIIVGRHQNVSAVCIPVSGYQKDMLLTRLSPDSHHVLEQ